MSEKKLHKVETRLTYLHKIKSPIAKKQPDWKQNYIWVETKELDPYKSNYSSNLAFSIINAKASEILSWMQEYDFIPLSNDAQRNVLFVQKLWEYEWLKSNTDREITKAIYSWLKYWDWFIYEWTRRIDRKIKVPYKTQDWTISYNEKTVTEKDWIHCEYIPWENLFYDWYDIEDANEAIWLKYWDRKTFLNTFWENPNFKNVSEELPKWRYYSVQGDTLKINPEDVDDTISELRYYNKANDELIILANWIEVYNWIIPYAHKELPFCVFSDYHLEDRTYNAWEYEILETDIKYKDALRALNIDVIKAQFWFTAISPEANFDEATIEIWTDKFARVDPADISHYAPNISANNVIQAEQQADNDIIIKSGIDFKSQTLTANETATKVQSKLESARKRINLNLKLNWYTFFARLARLRMANLQVEYWSEQKKIPVKWLNISSNGVATPVSSWYWLFTVKPELIKWEFNIIPITDSILWISTEKEKNKLLEFYQLVGNVEDWWKPVVNPKKAVEQLSRKFWVDFEELTQATPSYQEPEQILDDLKLEDKWTPSSPTDPSNPNFVPPNQRSGAVQNFKSIWWLTQE